MADPSWYVYDGMGSVVEEVDVNGNITASKLFDVYGATRSYSGSPTTRQGFVGQLGQETDDETGLVYTRARYYDPGTGRFVSEDPAKHGKNWMFYYNYNPVNAGDPTGCAPLFIDELQGWIDIAIAAFLNAGTRWSTDKVIAVLEDALDELGQISNTERLIGGQEVVAGTIEEVNGFAFSSTELSCVEQLGEVVKLRAWSDLERVPPQTYLQT